MDEKRANIDLVFRNGLKDYEVLPPPEAWNNIKPVISKKQRPLIILRAAAAAAVLLSLGFLAYQWSVQVNARLENIIVAEDEESEFPGDNNIRNQTAGQETSIPEINPAINPVSTPVAAQVNIPNLSEGITLAPEASPDYLRNIEYQPGSARVTVNDLLTSNPALLALFFPGDDKISLENKASLYSPEIPVKDNNDRWTIAALVSPSYYTNFYTGKDAMTSPLVSNEQPVFSYSGGLTFSYKINKRVSVQSGLYYSSFGNQISGITSFGGFQPYDNTKSDRNFELRTSNGLIYTNNADIFIIDSRSDDRIITRYTKDYFDPAKANLEYIDNSLKQNFSYLELPFIIRYKLVDKTIDFNIVGGLSSNILINNSVYAAIDGSKYQVGKTEGMNLLMFSSALGMGMEYNISGNLSLNIEPTLRYYLNPFNQVPGLKVHPYSLGIFSGISYRF